jgi:hypothetical protein
MHTTRMNERCSQRRLLSFETHSHDAPFSSGRCQHWSSSVLWTTVSYVATRRLGFRSHSVTAGALLLPPRLLLLPLLVILRDVDGWEAWSKLVWR